MASVAAVTRSCTTNHPSPLFSPRFTLWAAAVVPLPLVPRCPAMVVTIPATPVVSPLAAAVTPLPAAVAPLSAALSLRRAIDVGPWRARAPPVALLPPPCVVGRAAPLVSPPVAAPAALAPPLIPTLAAAPASGWARCGASAAGLKSGRAQAAALTCCVPSRCYCVCALAGASRCAADKPVHAGSR